MDLPNRPLKVNWIPFALFLLLFFRVLLQLWLYRDGFVALTADDFGRTVMAANWARAPYLTWNGIWLPFHMYLIGGVLRLAWNLLVTPRLLTIILGEASIVLIYLLASQLYNSWKIGLIAALLMAVNPAHIWLSSVPLTEMPYVLMIFGCMAAFVVFLKHQNLAFLFLSAFSLALANGFRYEGWMVSIVFCLLLVSWAGLAFLRKQINLQRVIILVMAAALPWLFPIAWLIGNYLATGDALFFLTSVKTYNQFWYGSQSNYGAHIQALQRIDPYTMILAIPALLVCLIWFRRLPGMLWYLVMCTVPLAIFAFLQGGQPEPGANNIRYLAQFVFVLYPLIAGVIVTVFERVSSRKVIQLAFLALLLGCIIFTQTHAAFAYTNDPAGDGLAVGEHIRELRQSNPSIANKPVLIELSYWQYLAIHVGANSMDTLIYDRPLNIADRQAPSMITQDIEVVRNCIGYYDIAYLVIKSPELKQILQDQLLLVPTEEIKGYTFYPVPAAIISKEDKDHFCPLDLGTGY